MHPKIVVQILDYLYQIHPKAVTAQLLGSKFGVSAGQVAPEMKRYPDVVEVIPADSNDGPRMLYRYKPVDSSNLRKLVDELERRGIKGLTDIVFDPHITNGSE